jgi:predicted nucleic acid-binding protein
VVLCLSPAIVEEYVAVLRRLGLDGRPELDELLDLLRRRHHLCFAASVPDLHVVEADPEDDKSVACAVALRADRIVSGDHHLLDLRNYLGIPVLTPAQFLLEHGAR